MTEEKEKNSVTLTGVFSYFKSKVVLITALFATIGALGSWYTAQGFPLLATQEFVRVNFAEYSTQQLQDMRIDPAIFPTLRSYIDSQDAGLALEARNMDGLLRTEIANVQTSTLSEIRRVQTNLETELTSVEQSLHQEISGLQVGITRVETRLETMLGILEYLVQNP